MSLAPWLLPVWARFAQGLASGRMPHALLIGGDSGLGKRALVEAMVASLLCPKRGADGHACGRCRACQWRVAGSHPDLFKLSIDEEATQIRIEQIRNLNARLSLSAQPDAWQVAVIDPAEKMNHNAANALLKTLEEPSAASVLILVSDHPQQLLATIRSRCQVLKIVEPSVAQARTYLVAQGLEGAAAEVALTLAHGNPGLAAHFATPAQQQLFDATLRELTGFLTGRVGLAEIGANWAKDRPLERLDWLSRALAVAVCRPFNSTPIGLEGVARLARHADPLALSLWWEQLGRTRALLATPVRNDLLLIECLARARQVFRIAA